MKASDVMVSKVITVQPDATVHEIADILLTNRISAVPVVDGEGALLGIISESDLIHRVEAGTERHYTWWRKLVINGDRLARDFVKSHAARASDLMTRQVVTASPDLPLGDLAALLERHRIKRVPIVVHGKLVGIVSRADLLQPLAAMHTAITAEIRVDDKALRQRILDEIRSNLDVNESQINVIVHDGAVELWAEVKSLDEKEALRVAAESVPGVRSVEDHVSLSSGHYGL